VHSVRYTEHRTQYGYFDFTTPGCMGGVIQWTHTRLGGPCNTLVNNLYKIPNTRYTKYKSDIQTIVKSKFKMVGKEGWGTYGKHFFYPLL